jgi:hypothetical protein
MLEYAAPPQGTRKGYPYYTRSVCSRSERRRGGIGGGVYGRGTPLSVNLRKVYLNNRKGSEAKSNLLE